MQIPRPPLHTEENTGGEHASHRHPQYQGDLRAVDDSRPPSSRRSDEQGPNPPSQGSSSNVVDHRWSIDSKEFNVKYWFGDTGRVSVKVNRRSTWLNDEVLAQVSHDAASHPDHDDPPPYDQVERDDARKDSTPALSIVMHVVGSHDEVAHFIAVAGTLQERHGHRVRITTHPEFRADVEARDVEFYDIGALSADLGLFMGGDPERREAQQQHLLEDRLTRGNIVRQTLGHCWRSCIHPSSDGRVFVADAIIANPPSFAHMHCAEKLGVPLHIMSTIPWTTTREVAHPLIDIEATDLGPQLTNRLSYSIVELMIWRDIGDFVNDFREKDLGLLKMQLAFSPGLLDRLDCPVTYFRSSMCPKRPKDWPDHVKFHEEKSMPLGDPKPPNSIVQNEIRFATEHFLSQLRVKEMRCAVLGDRVAAWKIGNPETQLSAVVATVLQQRGLLRLEDLSLYRSREYDLEDRPHDPLTSIAASAYDTIGSILLGVAAGPMEAYRRAHQEKQEKAGLGERRPTDVTSPKEGNPYSAVAISSAKGVGSIMATGLKMPVTFTHGLAKGFHNVPKLYGDKTVRDPERITGVRSGLSAAGKGLAYGLYDGLTGFVVQPYQGAKEHGAKGFLKGFGKGLGGVVFKPAAGACGVPGYAFMGIYKQLQKTGNPSEMDLVTLGRLAQGEVEHSTLSDKEVSSIVEAWASTRASLGQKH